MINLLKHQLAQQASVRLLVHRYSEVLGDTSFTP